MSRLDSQLRSELDDLAADVRRWSNEADRLLLLGNHEVPAPIRKLLEEIAEAKP